MGTDDDRGTPIADGNSEDGYAEIADYIMDQLNAYTFYALMSITRYMDDKTNELKISTTELAQHAKCSPRKLRKLLTQLDKIGCFEWWRYSKETIELKVRFEAARRGRFGGGS